MHPHLLPGTWLGTSDYHRKPMRAVSILLGCCCALLCLQDKRKRWLSESHCTPPSPAVPNQAQGPSTLFLGMWQEAAKKPDSSFTARCVIFSCILLLNYYVLTAAGPLSQLFRWYKSVRFHFHQWSAPDLHNLMVYSRTLHMTDLRVLSCDLSVS